MADAQVCHACGREVGETVHTRDGARVDGFVLHTGPTEVALFRSRADDEAPIVYRRLLAPVRVVTCAACYADPATRARHLSWAYPGD